MLAFATGISLKRRVGGRPLEPESFRFGFAFEATLSSSVSYDDAVMSEAFWGL